MKKIIVIFLLLFATTAWAEDIIECTCVGEYQISKGEYADINIYKVEVCSWYLTVGSGYSAKLFYCWHNAYNTRFPKNIGKKYFTDYSEAKEFLRILKSTAKKDLAKQKYEEKMERLSWQVVK